MTKENGSPPQLLVFEKKSKPILLPPYRPINTFEDYTAAFDKEKQRGLAVSIQLGCEFGARNPEDTEIQAKFAEQMLKLIPQLPGTDMHRTLIRDDFKANDDPSRFVYLYDKIFSLDSSDNLGLCSPERAKAYERKMLIDTLPQEYAILLHEMKGKEARLLSKLMDNWEDDFADYYGQSI